MCGRTNKRVWHYATPLVVIVFLVSVRDPVEGWAVLLETNDFPEGYTDLPVNFVDIERMQTMLEYHGWQKSHLWIKKDAITPETVEEGISYLSKNADKNDIVLFYIASHGGYIRDDLRWSETFPAGWEGIESEKKLLIIDSCLSGSFLPRSGNPHLYLASVSKTESAWAGTPDEGLPITGFVFTYYFCESLMHHVSVEEGFEKSVPQVRTYMSEVVYPQFGEIYPPETFHNLYNPHPVMDDQYPGPFFLDVEHEAPVPLLFVILGILFALTKR